MASLSLKPALASACTVLTLGLLAWATQTSALAPPLGVTALLLFQDRHSAPSAPRSILLGHATGILAGWLALVACGCLQLPSALSGGFTPGHALAAGLSILLTALGLSALRCPHPPAGATTLVVSLGLLRTPAELLAFLGGACLLALLAALLQRAPQPPAGP